MLAALGTSRRLRVSATVGALVALFVAGVLAGRATAGPRLVEGYVTGISAGVICITDQVPDPDDEFYGRTEGLIGGVTGKDCAELTSELLERQPLRLGQRLRASVVDAPPIGGLMSRRILVDYAVIGGP